MLDLDNNQTETYLFDEKLHKAFFTRSARYSYVLACLLILCIIPIWIFFISPKFLSMRQNFSYTANIISLDNFYNEEKQEFSGEQRSVTSFSYHAVNKKNGVLTIKNIFDVRAVTGNKIFAVERLYGIDPQTGTHKPGFGDRDGYLFAPKHLKEGEPFTYWHINYDGPAHMIFAGKETLFGLPVYRYETRYKGVPIDQTKNLSHLPGVPQKRGVILEPYLQLWIEPTTGYLVKYQDKTVAYYYDIRTGAYLNPWNKFSNTYTRKSVYEHVQLAKHAKFISITIEMITPLLLGLLAIVLFVFSLQRKLAFFLLAAGFMSVGIYIFSFLFMLGEQKPIKIGILRWVDNSEYERNITAFKDALQEVGYVDGKTIVYIEPPASRAEVTLHRKHTQSLIAAHVDLIYSLTTPGTLIVKDMTTQIPIVFSIATYPVETGIVKSLSASGNNLVGSHNRVPVENQLAVFRRLVPKVTGIGFVYRQDEPNSMIQMNEMKKEAQKFNINVVGIAAQRTTDLESTMESVKNKINSLYSACDTLIQGEQGEDIVIRFAKKYTLPDFACIETGVRKGSLVGTVADFYEIGRLAGEKAVSILEGATPTSLESQTVSRPFIYVNKKRADELDITIPQDVVIKAKEIIK